MLMVNALKTVCDLLLGFSFVTLFDACSRSWLLIGAVLALGFLSSLILQKTSGSVPVRIFCALLPALGLFAARSFPETLFTGVVLAFYAVVTLSGRSEICYEDYLYWFGFPALPVAVVFVVCFSQWPIRPAATVCSAAYLFLGVLVLRRKRMGAGAGLKLRLVNLTELTGTVAIAILASILLYAGIRHSGKILETLLLPFGLLFNAVAFLLDRFISLFKPMLPDEPLIPEETESVVVEDVITAETMPTDPRDETVYAGVETLIHIVAILLALAVLAFLLYRLYKMLRRTRPEGTAAGTIEEGEGERLGFRRDRRKRRKLAGLSNNEKIRRLYRDYLAYVRIRGVEIARQTTSEDVLEAAGQLPASGEAERLRELYIRARYHDAEEMSDAAVEEANALLARIREQAEARRADPWIPNAD